MPSEGIMERYHRLYERLLAHGEELSTSTTVKPMEEPELARVRRVLNKAMFKHSDIPSEFLDNASVSSCGRVFTKNEPTYHCHDCGHDPTCVLCATCFAASEHQNHTYRISFSKGGGCCDCGDPEAWKAHSRCRLHTPKDSNAQPVSTEMQEQAEAATLAAVTFIHQYLLVHATPPEEDYEDECVVLLYNDEHHSFDEVHSLLKEVLPNRRASEEADLVASLVDAHGRCVVEIGPRWEMHEIGMDLYQRRGLRTTHITTKQYIMEQMAASLLQLLNDYCQKGGEWYRLAMCRSLMTKLDGKGGILLDDNIDATTIVEDFMVSENTLWKDVRASLLDLFLVSLIAQSEYKALMGEKFVMHYETIQNNFLDDDHADKYSVVSLSVQFLTVPSTCRKLIAEYDALHKVLTMVHSILARTADEYNVVSCQHPHIVNKRFGHALLDLRYLLRHFKYEELKEADLELFLQMLRLLEGMTPNLRKYGEHVEFDDVTWLKAFTLQVNMVPICNAFRELVIVPELLQSTVLQASDSFRRMIEEESPDVKSTPQKIHFNGSLYTIDEYDGLHRPVSFHHPLLRLLAAIVLACGTYELDLQDIFGKQANIGIDQVSAAMLDVGMRTLALAGQVRAQMWSRNGPNIRNQLLNYNGPEFRAQMSDLDIAAVQISAAFQSPQQVVLTILQRFRALEKLGLSDEEHDYVDVDDDHYCPLIEGAVHIILRMLAERHWKGLSFVSDDDFVEREIVAQLSVSALAHSELTKRVGRSMVNDDNFKTLLLKVANYRDPGDMSSGLYELKSEVRRNRDPYLWHYGHAERDTIIATVLGEKAASVNDDDFVLPALSSTFASIESVFESNVLLEMVRNILTIFLAQNDEAKKFDIAKKKKEKRGSLNLTTARSSSHTRGNTFKDRSPVRKTSRHASVSEDVPKKSSRSGSVSDYAGSLPCASPSENEIEVGYTSSGRRLHTHVNGNPLISDNTLHMALYVVCYGLSVRVNAGERFDNLRMKFADALLHDDKRNRAQYCSIIGLLVTLSKAPCGKQFLQVTRYIMNTLQSCGLEISNVVDFYQDSSANGENVDSEEERRKRMAELAKKRKMEIMAQFKKQQENFLKSQDPDEEVVEEEYDDQAVTCILCQDSASPGSEAIRSFGKCINVMGSSLISRGLLTNRRVGNHIKTPVGGRNSKMSGEANPGDGHRNVFISGCCHDMHFDCWSRYQTSVLRNLDLSLASLRNAEFQCPLCKQKVTALIPFSNLGVEPMTPRPGRHHYSDPMEHDGAISFHADTVPDLLQNMIDEDDVDHANASPTDEGHAAEATVHHSEQTYRNMFAMDVPSQIWLVDMDGPISVQSIVSPTNNKKFAPPVVRQGLTCLAYMMKCFEAMLRRHDGPSMVRSEPYFRFAQLLYKQANRLIPMYYRTNWSQQLSQLIRSEGQYQPRRSMWVVSSFLECDMFDMMTKIPFVIGRYGPDEGPETRLFEHSMHFCLIGTVGQALLYAVHKVGSREVKASNAVLSDADSMDVTSDEGVQTAFMKVVEDLLSSLSPVSEVYSEGMKVVTSSEAVDECRRIVMDVVHVYLRRSLLMFRLMDAIESGRNFSAAKACPKSVEAALAHLGFESELQLWQHFTTDQSAHDTLAQMTTSAGQNRFGVDLQRLEHLNPPSLIPLPNDYNDLLRLSCMDPCPTCNTVPDDPAICLLCGNLLCMGAECCRVSSNGECTRHALECGSTSCIYILPKACNLLIFYGNRVYGSAPPYLDEHGETDVFLRRGLPLHLSKDRYERIQEYWIKHQLLPNPNLGRLPDLEGLY
eukprot:Clim_evm3s155 gene=Clim_evmTU3s155